MSKRTKVQHTLPRRYAKPCIACGKLTVYVHPTGTAVCQGCQGRILMDERFRKEVALKLEQFDRSQQYDG